MKIRRLIIWSFLRVVLLHIPLPPSDPPGPPEAPEVTEIFKDHAQLSWKPPVEDGGTPVIGYHVERRLTSSARWMKVNKDLVPELTFKAGDLIEDNEYEFRIMAENKVGVGPPSSPSKPVVAKDPYGKWYWGPLLRTKIAQIRAWITKGITYFVWHVITHPCHCLVRM